MRNIKWKLFFQLWMDCRHLQNSCKTIKFEYSQERLTLNISKNSSAHNYWTTFQFVFNLFRIAILKILRKLWYFILFYIFNVHVFPIYMIVIVFIFSVSLWDMRHIYYAIYDLGLRSRFFLVINSFAYFSAIQNIECMIFIHEHLFFHFWRFLGRYVY